LKKTIILYITDAGLRLAERLKSWSPDAAIMKYAPHVVEKMWNESSTLVFIMASGIVVRTIAPLLKDKKTDPAVVVLDEAGKFAISLAGGHLGGANERAREIAQFLGGEAVITTASDVNNLPGLDLWARENSLVIEDLNLLPNIGVRMINNGCLRVYSDVPLDLPYEFLRVVDPRFADIIVTHRLDVYKDSPRCSIIGEGCSSGACRVKVQLYLRPVNLVVGIGCNSNTSADEIENAVRTALQENDLAFSSIKSVATIDLKENESGLRAFMEKYGFRLRTYKPAELNRVAGPERSEVVFKATGAYAVAEPAALLAAGADRLLVTKQKKGNVTLAIAQIKKSRPKGNIFIVGTGPGNLNHVTPAARTAIENSDVIVGYGTYLDLIRELIRDKNVVSTGMTQEVDRCRKAVELAQQGKQVAVISGGDPGVYAMAGLVFEILRSAERGFRNSESGGQTGNQQSPSIEVIPGVSAMNAAASRLGAPLMHDFACISLSDRLTPWDIIEKRLDAAAAGDFVIVLYNPRSKGRAGHLNRAREIILKHRQPSTAVGIVKGAMREHETV
jgi:cobalt-precorrin 5A hydrolase/precorrin-3B C17-methyltransferase